MSMTRVALIDLDGIVYKCGFSSESRIWTAYDEDDIPIKFSKGTSAIQAKKIVKEQMGLDPSDLRWEFRTEVKPVEIALGRVKQFIKEIIDTTKADDYRGFLGTSSDKTMYRYNIAKTLEYKGNRKDLAKPHHYDNIREYLIKYYKTTVVVGIEADDALGIATTALKKLGQQPIICSFDKDLNQIAGEHYDFSKKTFFTVTDSEACHHFFKQILTGDRCDNVPGLYKIGGRTADRLFTDCKTEKDYYKACQEAYKKHSGKEDWQTYLEEQASLVYILREKNKFWRPPV